MEWSFLDFVGSDGINQIKAWIQSVPESQRASDRFTAFLLHIGAQATLNDPEYTKMLSGECEGLMEMRFHVKKNQYRPLAFYGPGRREITILVGAMEKSDRFSPANACDVARRNRKLVDGNRRHVIAHDFT